jgi:predicted GTPase
MRMADVVIINKIETASPEGINTVRTSIELCCPDAIVIDGASPIFVKDGNQIKGKRVLVIEDGPTLTHGEMAYGAGMVAAKKYGAGELIDPRPWAVGSIKSTFENFTHLTNLLPAMGYGEKQIKELEKTIDAIDCDLVIAATPIDLTRILKINKPAVRVGYELQEIGSPTLHDVLEKLR